MTFVKDNSFNINRIIPVEIEAVKINTQHIQS
jgi:hypothetical protein